MWSVFTSGTFISMGQSNPSRILGWRLKQKRVAQFCIAALHGYVKEDPGRALGNGVSGRARTMQLQVAQGMHELLLSLTVRRSSNVLFLALVARPDCLQVVEMWPRRKAVMCESFPLIVLRHQQIVLLALWGCFVQDTLSYTSAVSNAEAILLFFSMPRFTQLISVLMFTLCPSASHLRVLMISSNSLIRRNSF